MAELDALTEQQRQALDDAVAFVRDRYAPWAIVAAGTIIRGEGDPRSDIDLYVLHDGPFRQRVQKWFADVPVEIFVNPESTVRGYIESEQEDGQPYTAHMLLTGVPVFTEDEQRLQRLRDRAQTSLQTSPEWGAATLVSARYAAATMIEDALDRQEADPSQAMRLMCRGVELALEYWFKLRGEYYPRHKSLLKEVMSRDVRLGRLSETFWGAGPYDHRFEAGLRIADTVLQTRGFFEWESEQQPIAPP